MSQHGPFAHHQDARSRIFAVLPLVQAGSQAADSSVDLCHAPFHETRSAPVDRPPEAHGFQNKASVTSRLVCRPNSPVGVHSAHLSCRLQTGCGDGPHGTPPRGASIAILNVGNAAVLRPTETSGLTPALLRLKMLVRDFSLFLIFCFPLFSGPGRSRIRCPRCSI